MITQQLLTFEGWLDSALEPMLPLLANLEQEICTAHSQPDCLEKARSLAPNLIVLAEEMPFDPWQTIQRLQSHQQTCTIPLVFCGTSELAQKQALALGCIHYLQLPLAKPEILHLQHLMQLGRRLQALSNENEKLRSLLIRRNTQLRTQYLHQLAIHQSNFELKRLAYLDGLTEVANRRYFDQRLQQEWQRSRRLQKPLSLMLCDIDYFKAYNDTYGHPQGDRCLHQVAQLIRQTVKRASDFVARYGGEEFALILPNTPLKGAERLCQKVQQQLQQQPIDHIGSALGSRLTLSIGVASLIPSADSTSAELVSLADKALYQAKAQGRNRFVSAVADSSVEMVAKQTTEA
ncbi:GGDEF domain-containing response regulator [Almyronema epifaneia]|uniref:Diguanylate cyclase domain-containing protein n=1 Tax=Almyronema epifaneia S1 TaxID=2991925 RepID=A0ABW6IDB6_9CYAN